MTKTPQLPGFAEKRKVLFGPKTTPQKMREIGERFLEADRLDDALEFLSRCDATDLVRRVATRALEEGDTPLLMRAKRVLREKVSDAEWSQVAAAAERLGKLMMAYVAHQRAGHEEEAARLRDLAFGTDGHGGEAPAGLPQGDPAPVEGREQIDPG